MLPAVPQGQLTKYYYQASSGNLIVIGDFLVAPTNGGVFSVPCTNTLVNEANAVAVINSSLSSIVTSQGFNGISDFDLWVKTSVGEPKVASTAPFTNYDNVVFIWRNSSIADNTGNMQPGMPTWSLLGHSTDTRINVGASDAIPTNVIRHEFAHTLLGSNNFHNGEGEQNNYWIPLTSAPGLLNLWEHSTNCWTAWDRQRLGWKSTGVVNEIAARNQINNSEVNGDLDAANPAHAGIYTLRDFATTGDAVRIKLPFIDLSDEYPEYIWLENHNGRIKNNCIFDEWGFEPTDCVDPLEYGLRVFIQIDKDIRNGAGTFSGYANYLRPISAEGCYDRSYHSSIVSNNCYWGSSGPLQVHPFIRSVNQENPLTGTGDNDQNSIDWNNDHKIIFGDHEPNLYEYDNGNILYNVFQAGSNRQLFRLGGKNKLGISTNPSTATRMNLVHRDLPVTLPGTNNLRKIYLNGISIEIISQNTAGEIQVDIKFDQTDIENDVRWCADNIILNPIPSASGFSLNIKTGKTLLLDRSYTPTRINVPDVLNGTDVFSNPTVFTALNNSSINLEPNSSFVIDSRSTLKMESNSRLDVQNGATLIVDNSSFLTLEPNSIIDIKSGGTLIVKNNSKVELKGLATIKVSGNGRIIIEDSATLDYFENASIKLNNSNSVLEIKGILKLGIDATFTFKYDNPNQYGYVLFSSSMFPVSNNIIAANGSSINLLGTSIHRKLLQINQEGFYGPSNLTGFNISNGRVELGAGSKIQPNGTMTDINLNFVNFTSTNGSNNAHRGLHLYGQQDVIIKDCRFQNGKIGIFAGLFNVGSPLTLERCIFHNNGWGIYAADGGINLLQCYFYNNIFYGVDAQFMSLPSYTLNGTVGGSTSGLNSRGINFKGLSTASLFVEDPNIIVNDIGLQISGVFLRTRCGTVSYNDIGFNMLDRSTLIMDQSFGPFTNESAEVFAVSNNTTIKTIVSYDLILENGNNDLTPLTSGTASVANGTLVPHPSGTIQANSNKWNASGSLDVTDYDLTDGINQISITDANPLSSTNLCGQAINHCPQPPCEIESITDYEYEEFMSPGFESFEFKEEMETALREFQELESIDYKEKINTYADLVSEYSNTSINEEERAEIHLTYLKMLEALGNVFRFGHSTRNANASTLINEVTMVVEL